MELHSHLSIDADSDGVVITDRPDLNATIIAIGREEWAGYVHGPCDLHVRGPAADRAAFLRGLSNRLNDAAAEVMSTAMDTEVTA